MLTNRMKALTVIALATMLVVTSASCAKRRNLKEAQSAYDRLEIGMSKDDACRTFNITCDPNKSGITYSKDFGMSLSGDEYSVNVFIRNDELKRVEIIRPLHENHVRKGMEDGEVIAEKGASRNDLK